VDRPEFCKLLEDIKQGLFDAVVVMDIDRLGRGNEEDWGKIERILREYEILVITPDKIYDLENEEDSLHFDIKKFFARLEYKQISKRLRRGKIRGAKNGKWTNGKPPYPYFYNPESTMLEVDKEKRKIYRIMIEKALQGYSAEEIAWDFNKIGYKSPGDTYLLK
jgi:site-specific DNA recombinase